MLVRLWSSRSSHPLLVECKIVPILWKTVWWFLRKLNILLLYNRAVVLLGIYPQELKTYVHPKPCTGMFISALFIIAKTCKQPRCLSVGEGINELWYIQTMEYYSTLKINELSSPEKTWRDYIYIFLSEKRQSEKSTYHMISNYSILEKQNYGDSEKIRECWIGRGGRGWKRWTGRAQGIFTVVKTFCMIP